MAKIQGTAAAKPDKKGMRKQIEDLLTKKAAEMLNGNEISKQLHKKIKKAGKLVVDSMLESTKPVVKTSVPVKKATTPKAAAKKSVPKKAAVKKKISK
jgi:hypothetical protein